MAYAPFTTPEDLAAHTKGAVRADDPRLPGMIRAASTGVRRYCRWHIAPVVTETITLDGDGSAAIALPSLRVSAVSAVSSDGLAVVDGLWRLSRTGLLAFPAYLSTQFDGVEVTLTHGYPMDEVDDVVAIVHAMCARALASPQGYVREQAGGVGVEASRTGENAAGGVTLLDHEKAALAPYRLVIV